MFTLPQRIKPLPSLAACAACVLSVFSQYPLRRQPCLYLLRVYRRTGKTAPRLTPLVEAIESGDPSAVSRVLEGLTPEERRRELTTECAWPSSGWRPDGVAPSSMVMLPIFHATCTGNAEIYSATLGALKASLSEDEVRVSAPQYALLSYDRDNSVPVEGPLLLLPTRPGKCPILNKKEFRVLGGGFFHLNQSHRPRNQGCI